MANVLNRVTKQYLKSINTPDYPTPEWIINPILPDCEQKYYVIEGDTVREMNAYEKFNLVYSTESTVYLITEKQLLTNVNGRDYESNTNAIINPTIPECDIKYTKMVDNTITEMNAEEKHVVDLPELKRKWITNIVDKIYKSTCVEEVALLGFLIAQGYIPNTNPQAVAIKDIIVEALEVYPKPT